MSGPPHEGGGHHGPQPRLHGDVEPTGLLGLSADDGAAEGPAAADHPLPELLPPPVDAAGGLSVRRLPAGLLPHESCAAAGPADAGHAFPEHPPPPDDAAGAPAVFPPPDGLQPHVDGAAAGPAAA
eukprot:9476179-Pyramimonas_sp.AAC.1